MSFILLASLLNLKMSLGLPSTSSAFLRRQNTTNTNAPLPGWTSVGCFTDSNSAPRTLQQTTIVDKGMTPELCTSFCASNFPVTDFAGVEFTNECYCDYDIQGTTTKVDDKLCNLPCGGDSTLSCGGASLISIFQNLKSFVPLPANIPKIGNWTFDGCFTDAVGSNPRTLPERFGVAGGVTIEGCTTQCEHSGFNISGLEFGKECWCGNSFSVPQANITAPLSDCSKACQAEPTELCGAASRLAVYLKNKVLPNTVQPRTVMPSTATPTSTAIPG